MQRVTELPLPPARPTDAHKGTFGKVLIIAGSRGMSGAAALSGLGALRGGAGLVFVASPESMQPVVAGIEPSYLTIGLPENNQGRLGRGATSLVCEQCHGKSVVAIGPGLGDSREVDKLVTTLYRDLPQPVVVDADALNALARTGANLAEHAGPRVLTPHPGEFARLVTAVPRVDVPTHEWEQMKVDVEPDAGRASPHGNAGVHSLASDDRERAAAEFAARYGVVLLLKGAGTVVTDGDRVYVNPTGNSGLATGGTGDVLTGLIAAILAQGLAPFEAAQLGAWMHGRAGDLAAGELSQPGLIASDLPRYLPRVWKELEQRE